MYIPEIIKSKPVFLLMKPFAMVQYGPPRSGSTLIYNIMRELFPHKKIFKVHMHRKMSSVLTTVGTYRNPLDSIASSLLRLKKENPTDEDVAEEIKVYVDAGLKEIPVKMKNANVLMLKYEEFIADYAYIFDNFEKFFNMNIPEELRRNLEEQYGMKSVQKKLEDLKEFSVIDHKTQFHGNHISKFKGQNGYYKKILTEHQIEMVINEFGETMSKLGYTI